MEGEGKVEDRDLFATKPSLHDSVSACDVRGATQNLALCHFDIEQALLQSELEKDVFMRLQIDRDGWSKKISVNRFPRVLKQASRR